MRQMPLLIQPVCAGGTSYHWDGNVFFGVGDASVQSEHLAGLEDFKYCHDLEHLFSLKLRVLTEL